MGPVKGTLNPTYSILGAENRLFKLFQRIVGFWATFGARKGFGENVAFVSFRFVSHVIPIWSHAGFFDGMGCCPLPLEVGIK